MVFKQSQGVSLAEVVLAVGLLTIISITVAGVFIHLLHASAKTSDVTAGRTLARRVLERAVRAGPPTWGYDDYTEAKSEIIVTQGSQTPSEFIYSVLPARLKSQDQFDGVTREIYYIEVEVKWWVDDPNSPVKTVSEMGRLSTTISQVKRYEI